MLILSYSTSIHPANNTQQRFHSSAAGTGNSVEPVGRKAGAEAVDSIVAVAPADTWEAVEQRIQNHRCELHQTPAAVGEEVPVHAQPVPPPCARPRGKVAGAAS